MPTECNPDVLLFAPVKGRAVVASFTGGAITSDAGALLLGATDRAIGLVERFAACFQDARDPDQIEHTLATLVGQRVFGIALGYEDLIDHDQLRHDPVLAVLGGKLMARRVSCARSPRPRRPHPHYTETLSEISPSGLRETPPVWCHTGTTWLRYADIGPPTGTLIRTYQRISPIEVAGGGACHPP